MKITQQIKNRLLWHVLPLPFRCRHAEYSVIASIDDEEARASHRLLDISIEAIQYARDMDLSDVSRRMKSPPFYPDIWPGEHYKLLAGLVAAVKPGIVIEIGTFTGLSSLSILKSLPSDSLIVTFDILSWDRISDTCLNNADFKDGRLKQYLGNLADPDVFAEHRELLERADLIFLDGPKNIVFEQNFLKNVAHLNFSTKPLFVLDDIRLWNMLRIWRNIKRPKLDLTSFGHWSGTGLIDWS
jgi:predicted O-methyltransferase YrrM